MAAILSLFLVLIALFFAMIYDYQLRLTEQKSEYEKMYERNVRLVQDNAAMNNLRTANINNLERKMIIAFPENADEIREIFDERANPIEITEKKNPEAEFSEIPEVPAKESTQTVLP